MNIEIEEIEQLLRKVRGRLRSMRISGDDCEAASWHGAAHE
jgi:hypothetical protein